MKKRRKNTIFNFFLAFSLIALILIIANFINHPENKNEGEIMNPFQSVLRYKNDIHHELVKYQLEKYTNVLLALMQQESHGYGNDPMQSSESAGLAPNTISDPKESIHQGIKHFKRVLHYGQEKRVDFPTIIQSYNMGIGYINYVAEHGGKHSEKLAKAFSLMQVKKQPKLYDCGGNKNNFRYPYCYGDFTYSEKVAKNIDAITKTIPVDQTLGSDKEPF